MSFDSPLLNAILAALLGVFVTIWFVFENPNSYRWLLYAVALACGLLGYFHGQPFIEMLAGVL